MEMNETLIPWAKNIPVKWEVAPNKYVMKKIKEICLVHKDEDILSLSIKGVTVRDLEAGGKMPSSFDGYQYIYPNNLLMCLFDYDVTPRCIGFVRNYGITSPAYSQFKMKNNNDAKYYYYYYLMIDNKKSILYLAKNLRHSFSEDELGKISVLVPPLSEQKAIADYLDGKCGEIDEITKIIEEQINTLEEYKKRLIFETVNKNVKRYTKIKYIATSINSNIKAGDLNLDEGNTLVYGAAGIAGYFYLEGIKQEYIGIIKDGAGVGRNNIYPKNTLLVGTMSYIFAKPGIDLHWLNYTIKSLALSESIDKTTIPHIYFSEYGNLRIPFPPLSEQKAIADYLDGKCGEIDEILEGKRKQLEVLKEYKQSVIYEYVTGKKEVPSNE